MEFDKSKVYTAANADELKIGSKVIVSNYFSSLRNQVEANSYPAYIKELTHIMGTSSTNRFKVDDNQTYNLAYLVSEPREKRIAELEEENAELKKECRRCVHTDCPCILSDYGKDRNGICDHFKDVFDENIELKEAVRHFNPCGEWNDDVHDCEFIHYAMEYGSKLTKAEEIMNIAIEGIKYWGIASGTERPFEKQAEKLFHLFLDKAEQFLKEV